MKKNIFILALVAMFVSTNVMVQAAEPKKAEPKKECCDAKGEKKACKEGDKKACKEGEKSCCKEAAKGEKKACCDKKAAPAKK